MRPGVAGSAAMAGTKLSKPVPGMREGGDQVTPSVDVERTIVFPSQRGRKVQSAQATYISPDASTAAAGSGGARRNGRAASETAEMPEGWPNVEPPSVERTA